MVKREVKLVRYEGEIFRITEREDNFPQVEVFTDGKFVSAMKRSAGFIFEVMFKAPSLSPEEAAKYPKPQTSLKVLMDRIAQALVNNLNKHTKAHGH